MLFRSDGTPYPQNGILKLAEASVDPGTGAVTIRVEVPNPGRDLLPGMFLRAVITEGTLDGVILVPQNAVTRDARGQAQVLLMDAQDTIAARPVVLDRAVEGNWIVREGLSSGDRVVVSGAQRVRPGVKVRIAPEQ